MKEIKSFSIDDDIAAEIEKIPKNEKSKVINQILRNALMKSDDPLRELLFKIMQLLNLIVEKEKEKDPEGYRVLGIDKELRSFENDISRRF